MAQSEIKTVELLKGLNLPALIRGNVDALNALLCAGSNRVAAGQCLMILLGTGSYGFAMGLWRAPEQALISAFKLPLAIFITVGGTGLLNGILAPLLGIRFRIRDSLNAVLSSFTIASCILASFTPLILFLLWNTNSLSDNSSAAGFSHATLLLSHVASIAFAGIMANIRLFRLLKSHCAEKTVAIKVILAWLLSNFLFGTQVCWILRPFIGSPMLPVQFLRPDAFRGNFYESVLFSIRNVF